MHKKKYFGPKISSIRSLPSEMRQRQRQPELEQRHANYKKKSSSCLPVKRAVESDTGRVYPWVAGLVTTKDKVDVVGSQDHWSDFLITLFP